MFPFSLIYVDTYVSMRSGIERTYLSHLRLGLLLSLLSSATLLQARLSDPEPGEKKSAVDIAAKPLGIVYFVASILAVAVGWWAYEDSLRGLLLQKAFVGELKCAKFSMSNCCTLTS